MYMVIGTYFLSEIKRITENSETINLETKVTSRSRIKLTSLNFEYYRDITTVISSENETAF